MIKTARQLKDKIRNQTTGLTGAKKSEKASMLIRNFAMERLLERISVSEYRNNFILKGGMLVAAYTGLDARSTMDIDTTVRALTLKEDNFRTIIEEIISIDLDDNVCFEINCIEDIMDEFDYPGLRFKITASFDKIKQPIKIDIATDDVITPDAVFYEYRLMFDDRCIPLKTYNLETLLAEKLQTIVARGSSNTRTRDFYDIYMLTNLKGSEISYDVLRVAFEATSRKRGTLEISSDIFSIIEQMKVKSEFLSAWALFKEKNYYVSEISWNDVIDSIKAMADKIISVGETPAESETEDISPLMV